jgi:NADH-quinone oxidoreductase subunit J
LTRFLLVFEVASFLLLIAAVGGVLLAHRQASAEGPGGPDADGSAGLDAPRPTSTGTTAEGVGAGEALASLGGTTR